MTAPDWSKLTPDEQQTLLTCPEPSIGTGLELLNFDLTVSADLTEYLVRDGNGGTQGAVQWDGSQTVPRQVSLSLSYELPWGTALVRVYRVLSDRLSGLSARIDRGVFSLTTPDRALGETVRIDGVDRLTFDVTGQDRTGLLDRLPGYSVVALADGTTTVLANLAELYSESGVPGYQIDSSASASVQPTDMAWPMISTGSDDTSSTDTQALAPGVDPAIAANADSGGSATWRQVINDQHSLVSYRAVWCDEHGPLRSTPYADPASRAPTVTIDGTVPGTLAMSRTLTSDVWGIPNRWIFRWSNFPDDDQGNAVEPTEDNGGVVVLENLDQGLSSQQARNNLVYAQTFDLTAATADDFAAQCAAKKAADLRVVTTYKFSVHPAYCVFGHFDVATLVDPLIPGGSDKVQITSWGESWGNDDIVVTAESVA